MLGEKLIWGNWLNKKNIFLKHIYTLTIVMLGWIFFASTSFGASAKYIKLMFMPADTPLYLYSWTTLIVIGILSSLPLGKNIYERLKNKKYTYLLETVGVLLLMVLCTAALVSDSYNPFLYFRF